jgi:phage-related baseplate assembly protein
MNFIDQYDQWQSPIDLTQLPLPQIVEPLSYEFILDALKEQLEELDPKFTRTTWLESDPMYKLMQLFAYRELSLRQRINEALRGVLLATSMGDDLRNLVVLLGVVPNDNPDTGEIESDESLRQRALQALTGFSTAGPNRAYVYHALSADPAVKDAYVESPGPGEVSVSILSHNDIGIDYLRDSEGNVIFDDDGLPIVDDSLLEIVERALNDQKVRPLTDFVTVRWADIIIYTLKATVIVFNSDDIESITTLILNALKEYVEKNHKLGNSINIDELYGALQQPGVRQAKIDQITVDGEQAPVIDIIVEPNKAAFCVTDETDDNYGLDITVLHPQTPQRPV